MPVFTRSKSVIMDRYRCPICQDLLIEPVSVTCGHTFCRLCLAKWTLRCRQTKCAQCQNFWTGQPHVTFMLRETIQELFPDAYAERAKQHTTEAGLVENFDQFIRAMLQRQQQQIQQGQQVQQGQQNNAAADNANNTNVAFWLGVGLAVVVAVAVYFLGLGPEETYVTKPVVSWTLLDCLHWLESIGEWTKHTLIPKIASLNLDGRYLLELNKFDVHNLHEILSNETQENQQSLQKALTYISTYGNVPPSNLWEYKDAHPVKALVFLEMISTFPRLGTLLIFVLDFQDSFLPLIHCVTGDMAISIYDTEFPSPTVWQYLSFAARLAVFPMLAIYTKALFVLLWRTNPWATLYTVSRVGPALIDEIVTVLLVLQNERDGVHLLKTLRALFVKMCSAYTVLYITSWLLPAALIRLFCNLFFYFNFIFVPLKDLIICTPFLIKFVKHVRSHSSAELWDEIKALTASAGQLSHSLLEYLCYRAPAEFADMVWKMYRICKDVAFGIYRYVRHSALGDLCTALKFIHGYTVIFQAWILNVNLGENPQNEQ